MRPSPPIIPTMIIKTNEITVRRMVVTRPSLMKNSMLRYGSGFRTINRMIANATTATSHHQASMREGSSLPGMRRSSVSPEAELDGFAPALPGIILPKFLENHSEDKSNYLLLKPFCRGLRDYSRCFYLCQTIINSIQ